MIGILGDIDLTKKPIKPQYFLAKPNREIISKLNEAYDISSTRKLNSVDELSLTLPIYIDKHHVKTKNSNLDRIHEKYLIKEVKNGKVSWYIVNSIANAMADNGDSKKISCYAYYHSLTEKIFTAYDEESKYCRQVLTAILEDTLWTIDYIDADFDLTYRAFSFDSTNVLEAIYSVAETYNALVLFDTDKRTVSFQKPELTGLNRGLTFSYGKYMKSMNQVYQTDQIVTRLTPTGSDGLGIQKVNPTGQGYIEDFGYWMYPFERDANKTVLSSSYWMSDSLCHALLDYAALVESKTGQFKSYLTQLTNYENELNDLEVDLNSLQNDQAVVTDTMLSQQFDGKMFFEKYTHSGTSSRSFTLNSTYGYAVMIKVNNGSGVSVSVNGTNQTFTSGQWSLLSKVKGIASLSVIISGGSTGVFIQVCNISLDEYNTANNSTAIVNRYSLDNKENQINLKKIEISNKEAQITSVKNQIVALQSQLLSSNNFTVEQLEELEEYVFEREFKDDAYIDPQDLYDKAWERFKEVQRPALTIEVDIVNFLEVVEEQRNWDKLTLGDFVNIKYEPLNTYVEARITQIDFDYESGNVKVTLSNAKDVNDESKRIEKFLGDTKATNVLVDSKSAEWTKAVVDTSAMSKLFDNFWNKVTNDINMASNEFVAIDRKGITITDPNDPLRFLRATHGVLGLTRSGGLKYETAISPDGVIAEMVLGKIILGERVVIGTNDGVFTIEGPTLTIQDRMQREALKLGLITENPDIFGWYVNRFKYDNSIDPTKSNVIGANNVRGFYIDKVKNGVTSNVLGLSLEGDFRLRVGDNNEVINIDEYGFAIGNEVWALAPFRVDYLGNAWLNKLFANDAEISNSLFKDGHIRGSDLIIGSGNDVLEMFPNIGLWLGNAQFNLAPFSVDLKGRTTISDLVIKGSDGKTMLETRGNQILLNNMDIVGAGAIDTELLAANIVSAEFGFISDLTANKLSTMSRQAIADWSNFINIQGNTIDWISGKVTQGQQKKLSDGRPLYWVNSSQMGQMTVEQTSWPVYEYNLDEANKKVKMQAGFNGSGDSATPFIRMGIGDNGANNSAIGYYDKYNGGMKISCNSSNVGDDRSIDIADNGIFIASSKSKVNVNTRDFNLISEGGVIKINNGAGCSVEMNGNTMTFNASNYVFQ